MNTKKIWQCRVAPSLGGGFAGTVESVWGTKDYENDTDPTVFFGLYGLPDFYALWRHKGRKAVLWAGSDIRHFTKGYWLDDSGRIKITPEPLAQWLSENVEHFVENEVEAKALLDYNIRAQIIPSFLGNVNEYEINYVPNNKYYTSVSGDDFELYGWNEIDEYAKKYPHLEFHLYGNTKEWKTDQSNVIVHGRVPMEIMDAEIKQMQGAIRLTKFDGFSEILAKSVLWGQWPVSPHIIYPHIRTEPRDESITNFMGRDYYKRILNNYPWNAKRN